MKKVEKSGKKERVIAKIRRLDGFLKFLDREVKKGKN